jgi:hypothetical protein
MVVDVSLPEAPRIISEIPAGEPNVEPVSLSLTGDLLVYLLDAVEIAGNALGVQPLRPGRNRLPACPALP